MIGIHLYLAPTKELFLTIYHMYLNEYHKEITNSFIVNVLHFWTDIKQDCAREVRQLLGCLTFLIYVAPDLYLIKALLKFWDPARVVFKSPWI